MIELGPGRPGVVDEVGVVVVTLANDGRSTQELGISYYSALFTVRQPSCASRSRRRRGQMSGRTGPSGSSSVPLTDRNWISRSAASWSETPTRRDRRGVSVDEKSRDPGLSGGRSGRPRRWVKASGGLSVCPSRTVYLPRLRYGESRAQRLVPEGAERSWTVPGTVHPPTGTPDESRRTLRIQRSRRTP
jgi:hypothetical protein